MMSTFIKTELDKDGKPLFKKKKAKVKEAEKNAIQDLRDRINILLRGQ